MSDNCDNQFKSFGAEDCVSFNTGTFAGFTLMGTVDNESVANEFPDRATASLKANWQAKIALANTAPDQAFYPLGKRTDFTEETIEDPIEEEGTTGTSYIVRDGKWMVTTHIPLGSWQYIEQLEAYRTGDFSAYFFDTKGGIIYSTDSVGKKVKPIRIQSGSLKATGVPANGDINAKVKIQFVVDPSVKQAKIRYLESDDLDFNIFSPVDLPALIETKVNITTANITTVVADLWSVFDLPIKGQGNPETTLTLLNATTGVAITTTSIVETPATPGEYTFTFASGLLVGEEVSVIFTDIANYFSLNSNQVTKVAE